MQDVLHKLKDFFWVPKSANLGFLSTSTWGADRTAIRPTDFQSQVDAFIGTVYSCVDLKATAVASVPLRFFAAKTRKGKSIKYWQTREPGKQHKDYLFSSPSLLDTLRKAAAVDMVELLEHPIIDLMRNVNGMHNQWDLIELSEAFLGTTGNGYWYIPRNGLDRPGEIWVLPAQNMKVIPDEKGLVKGYVWRKGSKKQEFDSDEIVHFKYPSLTSMHYGRSPLMAVVEEHNLSVSMNKYERAVLDNMGRPSIALVTREGVRLDQDKAEKIQNQWLAKYGGVTRAAKVAVLENIDIKDFGFAPREMSFLSGRRWTQQAIANAYKVPLSMLKTEDVNRANAESGEYQLARYGVLPECRRIEQQINQDLTPIYDEKLFAAFDNPVPEDKEFLLKERETNVKIGVATINEERALIGREPIPGLDQPLQPMNMMPVGEPASEKQISDLIDKVALTAREKLRHE